MKILLIFGVILSTVAFLDAAISRGAPNKKQVCKNGKCTDYCDVDGQLIKPGESFKTDKCGQITCYDDFSSSGESCGVIAVSGCKKLEHDLTKKYPECCNQICIK